MQFLSGSLPLTFTKTIFSSLQNPEASVSIILSRRGDRLLSLLSTAFAFSFPQTLTTGRKVAGEDHGTPTTETEGLSPAIFLDPSSCHAAQVGLCSPSVNAHPFHFPARLLGPLISILHQGCHPKPLFSAEASSSSRATIIFFQTVPRELCPPQPKKASGCLRKKGLS